MSEKDANGKPGEDQTEFTRKFSQDETATAATNPLSRRTFVGGVGASTAVAAAAGVGLPSLLLGAPTSVDWNSVAQLSQEAFRIAVNEWIGRARIQGGNVSGATAILTPGSLVSDVNIEARMMEILAGWRVPPGISSTVAKVLAASWNDWALGFQIQIPGAYPSFMAVPTPTVPPTRAAVSPPLSLGSSAGETSLKAQVLASRLDSALRAYSMKGSGGTEPAMQNLAAWVEGSFNQWKSTVTLTSLVGRGSASTLGPPYVPVAPVTSGDNLSAGPPLVGPPFGIVVR
jgi:hypothetical protein